MLLKRPLDTDQLLTFLEVVKLGTFTDAAKALEVSQPTVTARIQALESALGGPIFLRTKGAMRLTDLGQRFLPFARRSLDILREGIEVTTSPEGDFNGHIRMAAFSSVAASFLADAVLNFSQLYPNMSFSLREETQEEILMLLDDAVVELAHVIWPWPPSGKEIVPLVVTREEMVFVTAPTHPLAGLEEVTIEHVAAADAFYHLSSGDLFKPIQSKRREGGKRDITVPLPTARRLLLEGVGVGLFTRSFVQQDLESDALCVLSTRAMTDSRQTALVRHRRRGTPSKAVTEFVRLFTASATDAGVVI